jgi:hypothetical protein
MNIQERLNLVKGKTCWGVLAGFPNASYIHLHFGERIEREKIIKNNNLPYDLDKYNGEYHIGIFCTWRLQRDNRPITGSCESNKVDGPLVKGIQNLINKTVSSIEIIDECGDLKIKFGDLCLNVFCNYTGNEDEDYCIQEDSNWNLTYKGDIIVEVECGCKINTPSVLFIPN